MSKIGKIEEAMIAFSDGNLADINHLVKVHAYARLIALREDVGEDLRKIIEITAIVHDIACPLCREKYGTTAGPYQEKEGEPLSKEFLAPFGLTEKQLDRIGYLVGHHHTYENIDGLDYRILLEADFLVNADEMHKTPEQIRSARDLFFRTETGLRLLADLYPDAK